MTLQDYFDHSGHKFTIKHGVYGRLCERCGCKWSPSNPTRAYRFTGMWVILGYDENCDGEVVRNVLES